MARPELAELFQGLEVVIRPHEFGRPPGRVAVRTVEHFGGCWKVARCRLPVFRTLGAQESDARFIHGSPLHGSSQKPYRGRPLTGAHSRENCQSTRVASRATTPREYTTRLK